MNNLKNSFIYKKSNNSSLRLETILRLLFEDAKVVHFFLLCAKRY